MIAMLARLLIALFPAASAAPALPVQPDEMLADPVLEARARTISAELRCLVCQNQSIDDSNAPLARDLRILVRERLSAGASDSEVLSFIVDRYGEFVLLKPRFALHTLILWLVPPLALLAGALALWRRRAAPAGADRAAAALSEAEKEQLKKLVSDD